MSGSIDKSTSGSTTQFTHHIIDEWCAITALNEPDEVKQICQKLVTENKELVKVTLSMSDQITELKSIVHSLRSDVASLKDELTLLKGHPLSSTGDRMIELMEELRVIKERELNLMIREKIPCPFYPTIQGYVPKNKVSALPAFKGTL